MRGRADKCLLRGWLERHLPVRAVRAGARLHGAGERPWKRGPGERVGSPEAAQPGVVEIAELATVAALFRGLKEQNHGLTARLLRFHSLWRRRHILGPAERHLIH
ncbi:MAG TPA: hypothetical protein VFW75_00760 [Acetobacteraceae bacterium]|nr:hypothetical protein [Acetobacteraceae bacterium]